MAKTETMKCISTIKEDLDVAGFKQTDNTDRKTLRQSFDWIVGESQKRKKTGTDWYYERGESSHREIGSVGAKKSKLIKTVLKCISYGLIGPIRES